MTNEKERLVTDNINMANDIAWKYSRKFRGYYPFEELQSLAYLGLVKAADTFNPELDKQFSTYAYKVMINEILMHNRLEQKYRYTLSLSTKIDENLEVQDTISLDLDIESEVQDKLYIKKLREEIDKLSDRYKLIVQYKLQGLTMVNIGKLLNLSQAQISRDYQKAINILRTKFKDK